jgi:C4-dicarboxylate-specific signal transduction histidine kinase
VAMLAHQRERENRLMSMNAVAGAMAHEIKQPLTAMIANASAALRWLERIGPGSDAISKPLNAVIEDGHRAAEVIESIRGLFAQRREEHRSVDLNALISQTASALAREMELGGVSLRLDLGESLPAVEADRVQLQQVLVNLMTNAIESLEEVAGRQRRLAIRSSVPDEQHVLIEVDDWGAGIPEDKEHRLFETFFTTKARGVGMGLSLSRSIVEAHGGRLWATTGKPFGATFHLQLPRNGLAET